MTSMGASDFSPNGFTCVPEIRYPALITAERNITADGEVHFSVAHRLCRLKKRGTSGNSCKRIYKLCKEHKKSLKEYNSVLVIAFVIYIPRNNLPNHILYPP